VNSQPHMTLQSMASKETEQANELAVVVEIFSSERNDKYLNDLVSRISLEPGVSGVSWERAT